MLNNTLKVSFAIVGGLTGFSLSRIIVRADWILDSSLSILIYVLVSTMMALVFFLSGNKLIKAILHGIDWFEAFVQNMSAYELLISAVGLVVGLIVANLITIPIMRVSVVGVPVSIAANILFGYMGIYLASGKKHEVISDIVNIADLNKGVCPKIVDTSALIDGRIADIVKSGFLDGTLIIPSFILTELRNIADSSDVLKRNRGRRGLDIIKLMRTESPCPVRIENEDLREGVDVDLGLIVVAKKYCGKIVTTDYNLNKVADVQNIPVLNVNDLSNAVKPIALPGENLDVQIIKDGKENGQGIAYMDDGTMIVVDGGQSFIGDEVSVIVTSVLQTSAGRMVFAKPRITVEKII